MGAFRDKPAYLYVAVTLLGVYIILTLVSASSLPLEVRQAESVSYLKHIGLVVLNIYFLFSKNKALNYLAFGVLAILPFDMYAQVYMLMSSGHIAFLDLLQSVDGARVAIWLLAVLILATKLLLDYYADRPVHHGQST
jgi:hypothetical protein